MDITVEKKAPCLCRLKVAIPPEKVGEELDNAYGETQKSLALPGFRRGKVPRKLIQKKFGSEILKEVKEELVREAFSKAVKDHDLNPVDDPEIDLDAIKIEEGAPLEFEIELETRPEFELGEYKGVEIQVPAIGVADEEIDKGLEGLRNRFSSLETVAEPAKKGDFLTGTVTYAVENEEDLVRPDGQINTIMGFVDGIELPADKKDIFEGKKSGDEVAFEVPALPDHFTPAFLRRRPARIAVKVGEVKRITPPPLDEKFFKIAGVDGLDELRDKVREGIRLQKERMRQELIEERAIDRLVEQHPFELPARLLKKQAMRQEFTRRMEMARLGFSKEDVEEKAAQMRDRNEKSAERFLRYSFIFDKIADKEKIYVTEGDVDQEINRIAAARRTSPEAVKEEFEENDLMSSLRARLREDKVRELLRAGAKIAEIEESGAATTTAGEDAVEGGEDAAEGGEDAAEGGEDAAEGQKKEGPDAGADAGAGA